MKRLKVAVIGAGYFSQFHYDAWSRIADVELVGLCEIDRARAELAAARWSVPRIFDDPETMLRETRPDLVDIVTPPPTHFAMVSLAAAHKVHVICQKAFCRDITEAQEAARIADETGIVAVVHENFRFQPWYGEMKRRIEAGELGEIYQARFNLRPGDGQGANAYLDRQPYFQKMEKFLVHETAVHFIDTFRYLFGEIGSVFADLRRQNPVIAGEDAGIILFRHQNGIRSLFDGNRLSDHAASNQRLTMGEMLIEGERGAIRLDGDGRVTQRAFGSNEWTPVALAWDNVGFAGDCVKALQQHVVDHLLKGAPIANAATDYIRNIAIEDAVYLSARTGSIQPIVQTTPAVI